MKRRITTFLGACLSLVWCMGGWAQTDAAVGSADGESTSGASVSSDSESVKQELEDADIFHVEDDIVKEAEEKEGIDIKEIIFEHLGAAYGWEMPFATHRRIPLPIILIASDGLHCFSSARVAQGHEYKDCDVNFVVPQEGEYKGKCVEILPDGKVDKPWDISITKNVLALFVTIIIVLSCCFALVRWYRRNGYKAPRGML